MREQYQVGADWYGSDALPCELPDTMLRVLGARRRGEEGDKVSGKAVVKTNADGSISSGNCGRVVDLGVQVTLPIGRLRGMAFKWEHDTLVQNRPRGNTLWFQFVVCYLHQ